MEVDATKEAIMTSEVEAAEIARIKAEAKAAEERARAEAKTAEEAKNNK